MNGRRGREDGGFVLVVALLLLLATTLAAAGAWSVARLEWRVASAHRDRVVAAFAGRARLTRVVHDAENSGVPGLPGLPTSVRALPAGPMLVELRTAIGGTEEVVALLARPTAIAIVREAGGVVVSRIPMTAATTGRISPRVHEECGAGDLVTRSPWPDRSPTVAGLPADSAAALLPALPAALDALPDSGVVTSGGGSGAVSIRGAGVVAVVAGRAVVEPGASVRGWLHTFGDLRIRGGGRVEGAVRAGGRLEIDPGGVFVPSPCEAARALASTPLIRARRVGPIGWPRR